MKTHQMPYQLLLLVAFLALGLRSAVFAQGAAFTYQGQLKAAGVPVNVAMGFVFTLWDAATGGNQIGAAVTLNAVPVSNGLFTVALDFGANGFTGSARWLEIAVNGTALSPRHGNVTIGGYGYFATGGEENLRIVRGKVNFDGSVETGCCFSVNHYSTGTYSITFAIPFSGTPVVTVTGSAISGGPMTAGVGAVFPTDVAVFLRRDNSWADSPFHFIAIGPR